MSQVCGETQIGNFGAFKDVIFQILDMCCFQGLPCHLYFDLEFSKRENAARDGDEMVDLLISVIFDALLDKYSLQGNHEWILELDSSTEGMSLKLMHDVQSLYLHTANFYSKLNEVIFNE